MKNQIYRPKAMYFVAHSFIPIFQNFKNVRVDWMKQMHLKPEEYYNCFENPEEHKLADWCKNGFNAKSRYFTKSEINKLEKYLCTEWQVDLHYSRAKITIEHYFYEEPFIICDSEGAGCFYLSEEQPYYLPFEVLGKYFLGAHEHVSGKRGPYYKQNDNIASAKSV